MFFIAARERSSLMMASAGISHIVVSVHSPWNLELELPVLARSSYSGSWKSGQPLAGTRARRSACLP
jgi:hypothetical protein